MSSPFSERQLNDFRRQGDPLADEVIEIFAKHYNASIQDLVDNLENIIRIPNEDKIIDSVAKSFPHDKIIQETLEQYFTQAVVLPDWIDAKKLTLASRLFQDHVFTSIMILGCASLPTTYICQPDTKVLGFTRLLINDAPKRLVETAQMVSDVMSHGGIKVEGRELTGKGIQSILKIRLIHACIRYLMLNKESLCKHHPHLDSNNSLLAYVFDEHQDKYKWSGEKKPVKWNVNTDGVPINQEALAIILLTFSYIILRGWKKLGIKLNDNQQNAYLHSWNVVGYVLGVDESFLKEFTTYKKSAVIYQQILQRRRDLSLDGKLLENALLEAFAVNAKQSLPYVVGKLLPVRYLAKLTTTIIMQKDSYKELGIKLKFHDHFFRFFLWIFLRGFGYCVNLGFLRHLSDKVFKNISKTLWSWRTYHPDQSLEKTGTYKPLLIPHMLIRTSFESGKYKN